MIDVEKLEDLLLSAEGPDQALAIIETLSDDVPWEDLLIRVTAKGHPFNKYPRDPAENEGFRPAFKFTLGRFEPFESGSYRAWDYTSRANLVLRLLALAPESLEVRQTESLCIDAKDRGAIDGLALSQAFPKLKSLALLSTELEDWDDLSRLKLEELRLHKCRGFDAMAIFTCARLGVAETSISDGRPFGAVTHLVTRGHIHPEALEKFQSLRHLRCVGWSSCTNAFIEAMASLPELEVVDVDSTSKSTTGAKAGGKAQYVGADLSGFARTKKLRVLRLRQTIIDPHRLHTLLDHPALEELQLDTKWKRRVPKQVRPNLPWRS